MSGILWVIIVGFVAGIIARMLSPGPNNPSGFILTTVLGIAGAFLATWIGQAIGHYGADQGAGFITATIGALIVLFIWNRLVARGVISDHGTRSHVVAVVPGNVLHPACKFDVDGRASAQDAFARPDMTRNEALT